MNLLRSKTVPQLAQQTLLQDRYDDCLTVFLVYSKLTDIALIGKTEIKGHSISNNTLRIERK